MRETVLVEPLSLDFTRSQYVTGYDFEPVKFRHVARILWWALGKMKAIKPHFTTSKPYKFKSHLDNSNVRDAVFEVIKNRLQYGFRIEDYAVIMGHETFRDLMHDQRDLMPIGAGSLVFDVGRIGYQGRLFNVPVHVVDTIRGVALVPKIIIERK